MAEETEVKPFNEGGVKGTFITPSDSVLDKLFANIPKKEVVDVTDSDEEIRAKELKAAEETQRLQDAEDKRLLEEKKKTEQQQQQQQNSGKTEAEIKAEKEAADTKKIADDKAKAESGTQSTENEGGEIIQEFIKEFGDIKGEYEDTTDGLKQYIHDILPTYVEDGKKQGVTELFQEYPLIRDLAKHIADGYGIESFQKQFEVFDYTKLEVKEDDKELQEKLYRAALKAKGNDESDIEDLVETAKDSGKLIDKAKASVTTLDTLQKAEIEKIKQKEKAATEAQQKQDQATLLEVSKILKGKTIMGIEFPPEKMKQLSDFGSVVDEKGLTERDKRWNNITLEEQLLIDLILMGNFKEIGAKSTAAGAKAVQLATIKKKADAAPKVDMTSSTNNEGLGKVKINLKELFQNN